MPNIRLHYFNTRGRAEVSRMILELGDAEYEDVRVEFSAWPEFKKHYIYGSVPMLDYNGQKIAESRTIARFLARKFNMMADSDGDNAVIDEVADAADGMVAPLTGAVLLNPDMDAKVKILKEFRDGGHKKFLDRFEELLTRNEEGKGFLVGNKLTWGDLAMINAFDYICTFFPTILDCYPTLKAYRARILQQPRLAEYLAKRPECQIIQAFDAVRDKL